MGLTKRCCECGEVKPRSAYYKNKTKSDRLQTWCKGCHDTRVRGHALRRMYGITEDDYDEMYRAQRGCCWICGVHQSTLKRRLNVDHDHESGDVRALLCCNCNKGIGLLGDDPKTVQRAADYLRFHSGVHHANGRQKEIPVHC